MQFLYIKKQKMAPNLPNAFSNGVCIVMVQSFQRNNNCWVPQTWDVSLHNISHQIWGVPLRKQQIRRRIILHSLINALFVGICQNFDACLSQDSCVLLEFYQHPLATTLMLILIVKLINMFSC